MEDKLAITKYEESIENERRSLATYPLTKEEIIRIEFRRKWIRPVNFSPLTLISCLQCENNLRAMTHLQ